MGAKESLNQTPEVKERVFAGIVDLLTLCIFLTVYPYMRSERKDVLQVQIIVFVLRNKKVLNLCILFIL